MTHRSPRSDARGNRARLIRVGAEVLIADGPGATVAEIVKRAGVSETLFFSHFASKEDLIAALVIARLEALRRIALKDGQRLETYIWEAAADLAPHRAYLEIANYHELTDERAMMAARGLEMAVGRLIADADLRNGTTPADVHALIMIGTLAAAPYLHARPDLWRRFVGFLVAGLAG